MAQEHQWQSDDAELPEWAQGAGRPKRNYADWRSIPAPRPYVPLVLLGRLLVWRFLMAAAFFGLLYFGRTWLKEGKVAEYAVLAGFAGFALGAYQFIESFHLIDLQENLRRGGIPFPYMYILVLKPLFKMLIGPALVFASAVMQYIFPDRFLAVLLLSVTCILIHWRLGPDFLTFSRDRMLAGYLIDPDTRARFARLNLTPNLQPLCVAIGIALIVPALASVTFGIVILVAFLSIYLARQLKAVMNYGPWRAVGGLLQMRARHTVYDFFDYQAFDEAHWRPPTSRFKRRNSMLAMTLSLDLALLVALSCFFPWELCASFSVPGYSLPFSAFVHYPASDFRWLVTPIELAREAEPPLLYLSGILIAIPLFILVPPAVLLATYFQPLVELENLSQSVERPKS